MKNIAIRLAIVAVLAFPVAAAAQETLNDQLTPIRAKYELPALAAAVIKDGKIIASGAVGVRVSGTDIAVQLDDRFHIGSDTKAMTATLAGMMIEEGKLRWNSTIGEVLGPVIPGLRPKFAAITLEQLLSHTSGVPTDNDEIIKLYYSADAYDYTLTDYRLHMIKAWGTKHDPSVPKASPFQYANLGYIIVGAMIEKVSGEPWDNLIFTRIFEPLGLKSAGLGPQATFGKYDAPVGHRIDDKGKITSRPWGQAADLPAAVGPAGLVHMNVEDFATWAGWNAGEGKRGPAIIKPETLKRLHAAHITMEIAHPKPGTPKTGSYGFGWGLSKFDWSDKPLLTHNGSNGMNFSSILVDVENDAGVVVMTNIAGPNADPAAVETMKALYERYVKAASAGP